MKAPPRIRPIRAGWPVLVLAVLSCVDTETVLVERQLYEDPPTGAQGFLGYSDMEARLPVCGNCHVGQNSEWRETAHAGAWDDLQDSGHAQESCEGCHSVGALGNVVTEVNVAWTATRDERYTDVQCESCHGPGLEHVTNPDATQPLASIVVGEGLTSGCGECHQGAHNPFVEEWALSRHGDAGRENYRERDGCRTCHGARGAFEAWGIRAEYIEKFDTDPIGITCAVCHDPHDPSNEGQLRWPIDVADVDINLCMKCHQQRAVPDPESSRGPHSPQGPLLLGEDVGWRPPNFQYENGSIVGTHGSEANPRLCAGCHVNRYEVTDELTGDFVFNSSGHLFKPIPCLDEQGIPTAAEDCALEERSFESCTTSGCHGSQSAARSAYLVATMRISDLVAELEALLAMVPEDEFDTGDAVFTTAEGARFNAALGDITSSAIHNPFLTEALLVASIRQMRDDYGLGPATAVNLELHLERIR